MKIVDFKEGDFITRTARTDRKFGGGLSMFGMDSREPMGDGSYIGDKLLFLGILAGCIYYKHVEGILKSDELNTLPMSDWDDDHWDYYPQEKLDEWKKKYSESI